MTSVNLSLLSAVSFWLMAHEPVLANGKTAPWDDKASSECARFLNNISAPAMLNICGDERPSLFCKVPVTVFTFNKSRDLSNL